MSEKVKTAWMWADEIELRGLEFDPDKGRLAWFDQAGCHCGDPTLYQSLTDFLAAGVPAWIGEVPEDVQEELKQSITFYSQSSSLS